MTVPLCRCRQSHLIVTLKRLNMIGTTEIIAIVVIVLLLFGGKKIPELMHGLGKGVKSFKDGMNGVGEEKKKEDEQ